jgi:hypothetical protein
VAATEPEGPVSVKVLGVKVAESIERENVTVTDGVRMTFVAPLAGFVAVTCGAVSPAVTVNVHVNGVPSVDWSVPATVAASRAVYAPTGSAADGSSDAV